MAVSANVGGWIADTLVSKGYSVTLVRKLMQTVSTGQYLFLGQHNHHDLLCMAWQACVC